MAFEEIRRLNPTARDLRRFGLLLGLVTLIVAGVAAWRSAPWHVWLWIPGLGLSGFGIACPRLLRWIYLPWMTLGILLGTVMSTVLLTLLFFLLITPLALLARALRKDFLDRQWNRAAPSYWIPRDTTRLKTPDDYLRQF